jgi:hypothetical protein
MPAKSNVVPMNVPTQLSSTWPIPGDAPDLRAIAQAQAGTIADQAALIDAYQSVLKSAQAVIVTSVTSAASVGTALSLGVPSGGVISLGATVTGTGIAAGTTITAQQSGVINGAGVYTTSAATTCASGTTVTVANPGVSPTWPTPTDSPTLNAVVQTQTAIIRNQTALLMQYQDLLNVSATPIPPTGP